MTSVEKTVAIVSKPDGFYVEITTTTKTYKNGKMGSKDDVALVGPFSSQRDAEKAVKLKAFW